MHIQKMILENKIASTVPIFDLLAFKHSTEQHMLLLNSMNVLQNLKYYHDGLDFEICCQFQLKEIPFCEVGGPFKDILAVHRDVINQCISSAGGIKTALSILMEGSVDPSMPTHQWPEQFRYPDTALYFL